MYIVPIAWLYVVVMMAVAEATNSNGTVLGAIVTFVLYGLLPIGLILYFMGAPGRKRRIRAREAAELQQQQQQHAASLQPNAGSQGEYTGLLVIRAYHRSRNQANRNICLIPTSAHGTNPASAVMSGMKVVTVNCDNAGNIDIEDLRTKAEKHAPNLSALMVTYPSTHGVFEAGIKEI